MSSAETPHQRGLEALAGSCLDCPVCGGAPDGNLCVLHAGPEAVMKRMDCLNEEVKKLKGEKLNLLRQKVVSIAFIDLPLLIHLR